MVKDYTNPANINETVAEIRDQSGPQDLTSSGVNFFRSNVKTFIKTAYDLHEWEESKYGNPRTKGDRIIYEENKARDPSKQFPHQILYRHGTAIINDSTPFHERFGIYFRNGSYLEFKNNATHYKSRGDEDSIVTGSSRRYVKGDQFTTIDGRHVLLIRDNEYRELHKNLFEKIKEDIIREVSGSIKEDVSKEISQVVGNLKIVSVPVETHNIGNLHHLQSDSDSVKCPDYAICAYTGRPHANINMKVMIV